MERENGHGFDGKIAPFSLLDSGSVEWANKRPFAAVFPVEYDIPSTLLWESRVEDFVAGGAKRRGGRFDG